MATLPSIGQEEWGGQLNEWLIVGRMPDGSLRSAMDGVFNVLNYGADPTGNNDSGSAIQDAADAALAAGGGSVFIPAGNYRITTPVVLVGSFGTHAHEYISFVGDQWGGTQLWPGAAGIRMITIQSDTPGAGNFTHFFRFEDLSFDSGTQHGGPGFAADSAIYLQDVSHFQILGCSFLGFQTSGEAVVDTVRCAWGQMHQLNFVDNLIGTICIDLKAPSSGEATFGHFISSTLFGPRNSNCIHVGLFAEGTIISGCHFAFHPSGYSMLIEGFEQTIANNYIYPHTEGGSPPNNKSIGASGGANRQKGIVINGGYQILLVGNFMENAQEWSMIDISNDVARSGGGAQISVLSNIIRETGQPSPEPIGADPESAPPTGDGAVTVRASAGTGIVIKGNSFQSNYTSHHIKVEDIGNGKRLDIEANTFDDRPQGTIYSGGGPPPPGTPYNDAGEDIFLANRANDGIRFGEHYFEFDGIKHKHSPVGTALVFADGDTTPSVSADALAYTYASGSALVNVTNFDDGYEGQEFFIVPQRTWQFTYAAGGPISCSNAPTASPVTVAAFHMVRFIRAGGRWHAFVS